MAGDIFFTDDEVWSSNTNGFVHIIGRVIEACRSDGDEFLVATLSNAEAIRSLGLNLLASRNDEVHLTRRVLEAAREELKQLKAVPDSATEWQNSIESLVNLAQAHLARLDGTAR